MTHLTQNEHMSHMTVPFAVKQVMDDDDDFFEFEGYASTFGNVDLGSDRVMPGAFRKALDDMRDANKQLPILWQHDMGMPLGTYPSMSENTLGLYVRGRMPKSDDFVRGRVIPQMRAGSVAAMSIGYIAKEYEMDGNVRNLKEVALFEVSLVTMPMNSLAQITAMKHAMDQMSALKQAVSHDPLLPLAPRERSWDSDAAIQRVREHTDSEDAPTSRYARAFLWYDRADAQNFESYKLPIADVIDGELKAVPRAIFAAAAALSGARGGVDLPEEDRRAVMRTVDDYYQVMGEDSPFIDTRSFYMSNSKNIKTLTIRDIENILRNGVIFSKSIAKKIAPSIEAGLRDAAPGPRRDDASKFASEVANLTQLLTEAMNHERDTN